MRPWNHAIKSDEGDCRFRPIAGGRGPIGTMGKTRASGAALLLVALWACAALLTQAHAATHYVNLHHPTPVAPFTNWATATTTIQAAVDAAAAGDEILVTNGIYATGGRAVDGAMTNRVVIDKEVTVRSVNGPGVTIIEGAAAPGGHGLGDGAIRCVYLRDQAVLSGFTLTNGHTRATGNFAREQRGGGARCVYTGLLTNCILTGNAAGAGGGVCYGTLRHCILTGNRARWDGGGAWNAMLMDCVLTNNSAGLSGGGACFGTLTNCLAQANVAPNGPDRYDPTEMDSAPSPAAGVNRTPWPEQGFRVQSWHVEDGLIGGSITALAQTTDGYLWVGTTRGLARYDGARFVRVGGAETNAPAEADIGGLLAARDGTLWIATAADRILQLSNGHLRARYEPAVTGAKAGRWYAFSPLAMDGAGTVWALIGTNLLLRFAGAAAPSRVSLDGLPPGPPKGVWSDHEGNLWLAKGLHACVWRQDVWKAFLLGFEPTRVESLEGSAPVASPSRERGLWFTVPKGWPASYLRRLTAEGWEGPPVPFPVEGGGARTASSAVLEDRAGRLWGDQWWAAVRVRTPSGIWQHVQTQGFLANCILTCLLEDSQGGVWLGTLGEGLFRIAAQPVVTLTPPSNSQGLKVNVVHAARDGALWLGTGGGGLFRWEAGVFTSLPLPGRFGANICTLFEDAQSNLWAGTSAGLSVLRGGQFVSVDSIREPVLALLHDRAGRWWAGGLGGLMRSDDGTNWTRLSAAGGESEVPVRGVAQDGAGRIWVAGSFAVWTVQGDQLVRQEWSAQFGQSNPSCILRDPEGIIWVGTGTGLFRWDGTRLKDYGMKDGLPDDAIVSLVCDEAGNLWAGTFNGVFGCALQRLAEYERGQSPALLCRWLGPANGLTSRECSSGGGQAGACRGPDGRIWVANKTAAAGFEPRAFSQGPPAPDPLFESLTADGEELPPTATGYRTWTSTRRFEFRYTAPDLGAQGSLRFRYRLEPLDTDWVDAGHLRVAAYSKLPPDNYLFRMMMGGSDGQWHEAKRAVALRVVPHLWERSWVRMFAGMALFGAIATGFVLWQRQQYLLQLARQEMQQAVDKERVRIARDLHDHLGASLTEIVLMSDPERAEFNEPERGKQELARISAKVRAMALALSDTVWAANPRNDNLPRLVDYLCASSEELCESAGVRYWQDVPAELAELPLGLAFRHSLVLAVREALNNALKHSGATEIWLRIARGPDRLRIQVQDQGRGFDLHAARKEGNGLKNLRERLAALGGTAEVESAPGQGTTVRLTVPVEV